MIALDPEDILGAGCAEAFGRVLLGLGTLVAGAVAATIGFLAYEAIELAIGYLLGGFSGAWSLTGASSFFLVPIWGFASISSLIAIPNALFALVYFKNAEEPTIKRFLFHAGAHQVATFISFATWFGPFGGLDWAAMSWDEVLLVILSLILQVATFAGIVFVAIFACNRLRVRHEEHLMSVASMNAVRRKELAKKIHVPPPPAGTPTPKARPLTRKEDEN